MPVAFLKANANQARFISFPSQEACGNAMIRGPSASICQPSRLWPIISRGGHSSKAMQASRNETQCKQFERDFDVRVARSPERGRLHVSRRFLNANLASQAFSSIKQNSGKHSLPSPVLVRVHFGVTWRRFAHDDGFWGPTFDRGQVVANRGVRTKIALSGYRYCSGHRYESGRAGSQGIPTVQGRSTGVAKVRLGLRSTSSGEAGRFYVNPLRHYLGVSSSLAFSELLRWALGPTFDQGQAVANRGCSLYSNICHSEVLGSDRSLICMMLMKLS